MKKRDDNLMNFSKKKLPWLIVLFLVGVVLLTVSNFIPNAKLIDNPSSDVSSQVEDELPIEDSSEADGLAEVEAALENRLETILSTVEGVGNVSVTITLENGPQYVYATNENVNESKVEEKDSNGGQRITTETTNSDQMVLSQPASIGGQQPVIVKEIKPEIAGILVAAEGADAADVRVTLARAVQTLLDIPAHKVSVLQKHVE